MNLHEQLGALEMGVDQLIQAVVAPQAQNIPETPAETAEASAVAQAAAEATVGDTAVAAVTGTAGEASAEETAHGQDQADAAPPAKATLSIGRPSQNEITMTIAGNTVSLHPEQVGQLIEQLANARASMSPEPPPRVPPGWRFVTTKNPAMAVQKQSNGDRVIIMRHTGHGWVPFTFSPDVVIQMYSMLTQR